MDVAGTGGAIAMRSISVIPSKDDTADHLLLGFAPARAAPGAAVPFVVRVRSADGTVLATHNLSASSDGAFALAPGSRPMVLPRGVLVPSGHASAVDLVLVAVNATENSDAWVIGVRLSDGADGEAATFDTLFAVRLMTTVGSIAKPGVQIVPLHQSLLATVGGFVFAVGEHLPSANKAAIFV